MAVVIAKSVGLSCSIGVLKLEEVVDESLSVTLLIEGEEDIDVLIEDPARVLEIIRKLLWIKSKETLKLLYEIETKKNPLGVQILN